MDRPRNELVCNCNPAAIETHSIESGAGRTVIPTVISGSLVEFGLQNPVTVEVGWSRRTYCQVMTLFFRETCLRILPVLAVLTSLAIATKPKAVAVSYNA